MQVIRRGTSKILQFPVTGDVAPENATVHYRISWGTKGTAVVSINGESITKDVVDGEEVYTVILTSEDTKKLKASADYYHELYEIAENGTIRNVLFPKRDDLPEVSRIVVLPSQLEKHND